MIDDITHAARLQERHERFAHASDDEGPRTPHISTEARTLGALIGLLEHHGQDTAADVVRLRLEQLFPCITYGMMGDGPAPYRHWSVTAAQLGIEALESDYSGNPQAAVTYLQTLLAPSQPVNRVLGKSAGDVMVSL